MKINPEKTALVRLPPDNYDEILELWYEYMKEAEKPAYDEFGGWDPDLWELRPNADDTDAGEWLRKRRAQFTFLEEWPIEVHRDPGEAVSFRGDEAAVTLTFFRYYTRKELKDAFARVLNECGVVGKKGPRSGIFGVAKHQPNDSYDVDALKRRLKALREPGVGDDDMFQIGTSKLAMTYQADGANDNMDSIVRQVYDLRNLAKRMIAGVRKGRFPNPDKTRYGDPDQQG